MVLQTAINSSIKIIIESKKTFMKYSGWILGLFLIGGFSGFSQQKYTEHTVAKGETISKIAQQYHVKASDIYALNPDSRKGIKLKATLLIPNGAESKLDSIKSAVVTKSYKAYPKETLYSIAKKHGITVNNLYELNPGLKATGLKNGQQINVPVTSTAVVATTTNTESQNKPQLIPVEKIAAKVSENADGTIIREIQATETKYAIAREYGLTVADLDKANPALESEGLKIGQKIIIPVKANNNFTSPTTAEVVRKKTPTKAIAAVDEVKETEIKKPVIPVLKVEKLEEAVPEYTVVREVQARETIYGISKEYGITAKELVQQNPKIKSGLPVGYKLTITSTKQVETAPITEAIVDIESKESTDKKHNLSTRDEEFLDNLVTAASENLGIRYRYGGTTKNGIDCSALMCNTFSNFDIQLPRTSIEQSQYGTVINSEEAKKGDLIFFKTSRRNRINHVGMIVDTADGDIKFIHASVSEGVIISSVKEKYYSKKVTQFNRVL